MVLQEQFELLECNNISRFIWVFIIVSKFTTNASAWTYLFVLEVTSNFAAMT